MKRLPLFVLVLLLGACQMPVREKVTIKELLPVGTILRLTQALEIPAKHAYATIANGVVVPYKFINPVDIYKPYCQVYLQDSAPEARMLQPDRFRVTRVVEIEDYSGLVPQHTLATRPQLLPVAGPFSDSPPGPGIIMYATVIGLQSERQPEVKEMVCGHWDLQGTVEPLTLAEMKTALGNIIVIEEAQN